MTYRLSDSQEIKQAADWLNRNWGSSVETEYYSARSLDEAIGLLVEYGKEAKLIAGGTDFMGLLKGRIIAPKTLINIKNITGLRYIQENKHGLSMGSLTLINDMERSLLLKERYPILYEAAGEMASPQIRNMATLGGDLCQEVRCWYYRRSPDTGITYNCRRKGETGICHALEGENQYHAIMGAYPCRAICGSDMATVLLALDARIQTVSPQGGRTLRVDELYSPLCITLNPGEIIGSFHVPSMDLGTRQSFLKFRIRKAIDYTIVSAAVVIHLEQNVVRDARIVLGGVSYRPYRACQAENKLLGEKLTANLAAEAAKTALIDASPLSRNAYKVTIAETLVKRAIMGER
jgi:xanthine dehydrogenase YagS FAD-binding subunit